KNAALVQIDRDQQLSLMRGQSEDIFKKSIDPATRAAAQRLTASLAALEMAFAVRNEASLTNARAVTAGRIEELSRSNHALAFSERLAVENVSALGHDVILISIIPALAAGLVITLLLSVNILRPILAARSIAVSIASGCLENHLLVTGRGEAAQLVNAIL